MLVEQLQAKLVGPPVTVGPADSGDVGKRALALVAHGTLSLL